MRFRLALITLVFTLLLFARASFNNSGKATLQVDNCGSHACALPYLAPRVYFRVVSGQMPPKGTVLRCSPGKTDYDCGDGLHLAVDSIQFQGQF